MTYTEIIAGLHDLKDAEKVIFKEQKFGIISNNSLGIYHKELKMIAKEIGPNNELALQLFDSGIYEGRLLCSKMFKPEDVTEALMEKWVKTFENWEICDSFSMGLFAKSKFAIRSWSAHRDQGKIVFLRCTDLQHHVIHRTSLGNQHINQGAEDR